MTARTRSTRSWPCLLGTAGLAILTASMGAVDGVLETDVVAGGPIPVDLSVSKTDSPDPVSPGASITYTIVATNNGPGTPTFMQIFDAVPGGTSFVSVTGGNPAIPDPPVGGGGLIVHNFDAVPPGSFVTMTLVVTVNPGTPDGTLITNIASTNAGPGSGPDPNTSNNQVSTTTTVLRQADISTVKVDSADPVSAGTDLTYTITATNNGPDTPVAMTIQDVLPNDPNVAFVSATGGTQSVPDPPPGSSGGTITHDFAGVGPSQSVVLTVVVAINVQTPTGTVITNAASGASSSSDPLPANNAVSIDTTVIDRIFADGFE